MSNIFNKKLSEILDKMDDKVIKTKLLQALDTVKKSNVDELTKKINKIDKDELLSKISEIENSKDGELKIDKEELSRKLTSSDFDKLAQALGENGGEIITRLKNFLQK